MAKVRSSIEIDSELVERVKKSAAGKKPARGWTIELQLLAEKELDRQDAAEARKAKAD